MATREITINSVEANIGSELSSERFFQIEMVFTCAEMTLSVATVVSGTMFGTCGVTT